MDPACLIPGLRGRLLTGMGPVTAERRVRLHRRVRFIVTGFGLDSVIEVLSAVAIAWQFTRQDPENGRKATVRVIGMALFALAAYVAVDASMTLEPGYDSEVTHRHAQGRQSASR